MNRIKTRDTNFFPPLARGLLHGNLARNLFRCHINSSKSVDFDCAFELKALRKLKMISQSLVPAENFNRGGISTLCLKIESSLQPTYVMPHERKECTQTKKLM